MLKEELRIVYMGTADFALEPLRRLREKNFNIVAVVTMPDKPAGRGLKLRASKIKEYALEEGIPVLQPVKLKSEDFVRAMQELKPDLGIVVAFRMLPEIIWQMPTFGTMNLHASLLPRYRGAAPIHWAVMNGDEETGVSCFMLKHELDTGDVIAQAKTMIAPDETTGQLYERLMWLGTDLLEETVEKILSEDIYAEEQDAMDVEPCHAPKLTKENTKLNYELTASELVNHVRGLNPFPTAWTELNVAGQGLQTFKVHKAEAVPYEVIDPDVKVGDVQLMGRKHLDVICSEGKLRILEIQPAGKRAMPIADFLNGLKLD